MQTWNWSPVLASGKLGNFTKSFGLLLRVAIPLLMALLRTRRLLVSARRAYCPNPKNTIFYHLIDQKCGDSGQEKWITVQACQSILQCSRGK